MAQIKAVQYKFFVSLALRDQTERRSSIMMDLRRVEGNCNVEINNRLDANVTVQIIGGATDGSMGAGTLGASETVNAGVSRAITPGWASWIGLSITADSTPSSGTISANGSAQVQEPEMPLPVGPRQPS